MSENATWVLGSVVMARPTGRFVTDEHGWTREVYTDQIVLDHYGQEVERRPYQAPAAFKGLFS